MTLGELIEALEGQGLDPDTPVFVATQPKWPMEYHLKGLWINPSTTEADGALYLVVGDQIGYAPEEVFEDAD